MWELDVVSSQSESKKEHEVARDQMTQIDFRTSCAWMGIHKCPFANSAHLVMTSGNLLQKFCVPYVFIFSINWYLVL